MSTTDNTPNDNTPNRDTHADMTPDDLNPGDSALDEHTRQDSAPQDDTLADAVLVDSTPEPVAAAGHPTTTWPATPSPEPVTTTAPAAATASGTTSGASSAPAATTTATPGATASDDGPWLQGPAPFAIVLGLLGLLVAGGVLVSELTDLTFPWADLGPWTVVAAGLVIVLVGAIGLRSSRRTQG